MANSECEMTVTLRFIFDSEDEMNEKAELLQDEETVDEDIVEELIQSYGCDVTSIGVK